MSAAKTVLRLFRPAIYGLELRAVVSFVSVVVGTITRLAQANLLSNGSFENGDPAGNWYGIPAWTSTVQAGGTLVSTNNAYDGTNVMRTYAYGSSSRFLEQRISVQAGRLYELDGWMRTHSDPYQFSPTNGYCSLLLQFYNASGTKIGANIESAHFTGNGITSWVRYTTGPCLAPAEAVSARVACLYYAGGDTTTNGWVEYDYIRFDTSTPSQAGAIFNPDFEVRAVSPALTSVVYWTAFGDAGAVVTNQRYDGRFAAQLWWTETLLGQSWSATPGKKYGTSGYMFTPSSGRFTSTNAHGVILLQFLDVTSNVLVSYESQYFTTSSPVDTWVFAKAEGYAPSSASYGRSMIAILGRDDSVGGSIYFDHLSQYEISETGTVAGLLYNPGFDDGPLGDAFFLSNNLPHWVWLGGSNAGFVVDTLSHSNGQSLAIVWPNNLVAQSFKAQTGLTYIVEGYVMTPSGEAMTSETAYATLLLEFYNSVGGTDAVSVVSAAPFKKGMGTDTWVKLSVTNRAPWGGSWVTGRVYCALLDPANGAGYGGTIYFDSVRVDVTTQEVGNSQSGALWNPGFEYTALGTKLGYLDNWVGFGEAGKVDDVHTRGGTRSLKVYYPETQVGQVWSATPGYRYASAAYAYTPTGAERLTGSNVAARVLLQFLDASSNALITYESPIFSTNALVGEWVELAATGVAPASSVFGRTLLGLLGSSSDFSGAVWFDDSVHAVVSSGNWSRSGLLYNPSFEDGPIGNAHNLAVGGDLPAWKWAGDTNAGFISREHSHIGEQGMVLTYPLNVMYQDFTVSSAAQTDNLLQNPGFEIGPASGATPQGWFTSGALGQEHWGAETGTNGVVFYAWTTGNWGFLGQDVQVNPEDGSVFTFSIRGLAETNYASGTQETWIKMEFWVSGETNYRYAFTKNIYTQLVARPGEWHTYTVAFTNNDLEVNMVKVLIGYGGATNIGGGQAAMWDNASLVQSVDLTRSKTYVASGYLMTPSNAKFNTDGSSWGELQLTFYVGGSTNPATEFTAHSAKFGADRPADTWIYFSVTGQAPAEAVVTGRLSCLIYSEDPEGDFDLAGVIWFDSLHLEWVESQTGVTAYNQWQLQHFGSTTALGTSPQEDYDSDGYNNWSEFIAGTQPTNVASLLVVDIFDMRGTNVVLRWPSVQGRIYRIQHSTNIMSGMFEFISGIIPAIPPMNTYTHNISLIGTSYFRVNVTNSP